MKNVFLIEDIDCRIRRFIAQSLRLQWASKASAKQRAGRAGRVSNGRVYRLVTRYFWEQHIPHHDTPELQRCSLESAVLKVSCNSVLSIIRIPRRY